MDDSIQRLFRGEKLYGDDFSYQDLSQGYEAEKEGYSGLLDLDPTHVYAYHELNKNHGFRHVRIRPGSRALGIGAVRCEEFEPIANTLYHITALDPSQKFVRHEIQGVPVSFRLLLVSGVLDFPAASFDLITCFGVLHHIANVSFVLKECSRCLSPRGYMLLREPIVSMGDWRLPRRGLTRNERGIPHKLLLEAIENAGFRVVRQTLFDFPPLSRLLAYCGVSSFSHAFTTVLDQKLCSLTRWNKRYHRTSVMHRFGSASVFLVLTTR